MQMRTNARVVRHRSDEIVARLSRLETAEPNAEIAGQPFELIEQRPQSLPLLAWPPLAAVDAVMAEVNAGQNNLVIAGLDETPDFVFDRADWPAAQNGPNCWNDAIGAVEQTTVLHF